jgi:alkane 1-monooxygenase
MPDGRRGRFPGSRELGQSLVPPGSTARDHGCMRHLPARFALAWLLPLIVGFAAWRSPYAAWIAMLVVQVGLALAELLPANRASAPAAPDAAWYRWCLRLHLPLQLGLLGVGVMVASTQAQDGLAVLALALGVGGVCGSQGITFAHELGHSRTRADRVIAWVLMGSVLYAHFMVEHYRGHHVRAATDEDPASARADESLWRFLPRTLVGSWRSAWRLERQRLQQLHRPWRRSPLAWAVAGQGALLLGVGLMFGGMALLFWLLQAAYAVFLLEAINYIEHYGLRRATTGGRAEPFGVNHAWNADSALTNCLIANLQRHSDHHMHAWKPYPTLEALPGPQLPTGYAGCLFLASLPPVWFRLMRPRLAARG